MVGNMSIMQHMLWMTMTNDGCIFMDGIQMVRELIDNGMQDTVGIKMG